MHFCFEAQTAISRRTDCSWLRWRCGWEKFQVNLEVCVLLGRRYMSGSISSFVNFFIWGVPERCINSNGGILLIENKTYLTLGAEWTDGRTDGCTDGCARWTDGRTVVFYPTYTFRIDTIQHGSGQLFKAHLFSFSIRFLSIALQYEYVSYGHHSASKIFSVSWHIFLFFLSSLSFSSFWPSVFCILTIRIRNVWRQFSTENDQRDAAHLVCF